jgi:hypothetical protein
VVENHAADELYVEVTHVYGAPSCLADYREGFRENLVECGSLGCLDFFGVSDAFEARGDAGAEFGGFGAELFIGQLFSLGFEGADLLHDGQQLLDDPLVGGSKYFGENFIENHGSAPIFLSRCREMAAIE